MHKGVPPLCMCVLRTGFNTHSLLRIVWPWWASGALRALAVCSARVLSQAHSTQGPLAHTHKGRKGHSNCTTATALTPAGPGQGLGTAGEGSGTAFKFLFSQENTHFHGSARYRDWLAAVSDARSLSNFHFFQNFHFFHFFAPRGRFSP